MIDLNSVAQWKPEQAATVIANVLPQVMRPNLCKQRSLFVPVVAALCLIAPQQHIQRITNYGELSGGRIN